MKKILHLHKPHLIFLCETKLRSGQVQEVCRQLGVENFFAVDKVGKSGGLAIMWNAELTVQINSYNRHHIDFLVQNAQGKS